MLQAGTQDHGLFLASDSIRSKAPSKTLNKLYVSQKDGDNNHQFSILTNDIMRAPRYRQRARIRRKKDSLLPRIVMDKSSIKSLAIYTNKPRGTLANSTDLTKFNDMLPVVCDTKMGRGHAENKFDAHFFLDTLPHEEYTPTSVIILGYHGSLKSTQPGLQFLEDRPLTLEHHEVDYDLESPAPVHYGYYQDDPFMSFDLPDDEDGEGFENLHEWDYTYDVKDRNKIAPPLPPPGATLIPSSPRASSSNNNRQWTQMERLERDTNFVLNVVPLGQLTMSNLIVIQQLMSAWSSQSMSNSLVSPQSNSNDDQKISDPWHAPLKVEQLIKRVVDDYNAGNPMARVSTKMYNMLLRSWSNSGLTNIALERVQTILKQMQFTYEKTKDASFQPVTQSFNYVLNLIVRNINHYNPRGSVKGQSGRSLMDEAELLLSWMEELYATGRNDQVQPDSTSYTAVINAYARSIEHAVQNETKDFVSRKVERALELYNTLIRLHLNAGEEDEKFKPNKFTYSSIINCLAKSGLVLAAKRADDLLQYMIKQTLENDKSGIQKDADLFPDTVVVSTVILAYAQIGTPGAAERAEQLLEYLEEQERQGNQNLRPDLMCYNHVIHGWTRCTSHRRYILKAESILKRLEDRKDHIEPDKRTYNMILLAWSRCPDEGSASRADSTLRRMLKKYDDGDSNVQPDTVSFSHAMQAWGRSQMRGAAERAESLLLEMQTRYEAGNISLKPTVRSFTAVLNAWSKTPKLGLAECTRVEEILHRMHYLTEVEGMDLRPDVFCYTIVLNCWGRSGLGSVSARRTEQLLEFMWRNHKANPANPKPNVRSYNAVIDAWYRSGIEEAPQKCEETLYRMIELYEDGETGVAPETFTFNTVINIWLRSSRRNVGHRIEKVFEEMERMYDAGNKACAPDVRTYTALLNFYSRCRHQHADEKSDNLLEKLVRKVKEDSNDDSLMDSVAPSATVFGFKSIIEAWSKSRRPGSAKRADAALTMLEQLYKDEVISDTPPASCYRSVIYGYASSDESVEAAKNCVSALQRMRDAYEACQIDEGPGVHEYMLVLNALTKSSDPQKATLADQVFSDFCVQGPSGSRFARAYLTAITTVIEVCATSNVRSSVVQKDAFRIATKYYQEANEEKHAKPNSVLFATYIKACGRLYMVENSERFQQIKLAFQRAHEMGLVNDFVISQLKQFANRRISNELLEWQQNEFDKASSHAGTSTVLGETEDVYSDSLNATRY